MLDVNELMRDVIGDLQNVAAYEEREGRMCHCYLRSDMPFDCFVIPKLVIIGIVVLLLQSTNVYCDIDF